MEKKDCNTLWVFEKLLTPGRQINLQGFVTYIRPIEVISNKHIASTFLNSATLSCSITKLSELTLREMCGSL